MHKQCTCFFVVVVAMQKKKMVLFRMLVLWWSGINFFLLGRGSGQCTCCISAGTKNVFVGGGVGGRSSG